jgi:DNA-directed RNA polymerase sigma subunit (sigma70/sigma32)
MISDYVQEQKDKAIERARVMYHAYESLGMTLEGIANIEGISRSRVRAILNKHGYRMRSPGRQRKEVK